MKLLWGLGKRRNPISLRFEVPGFAFGCLRGRWSFRPSLAKSKLEPGAVATGSAPLRSESIENVVPGAIAPGSDFLLRWEHLR